MRALDKIRTIVIKIADRIATARRLSRFNCGNCDRNEQCGLPPDNKCLMKALQITCNRKYGARLPVAY